MADSAPPPDTTETPPPPDSSASSPPPSDTVAPPPSDTTVTPPPPSEASPPPASTDPPPPPAETTSPPPALSPPVASSPPPTLSVTPPPQTAASPPPSTVTSPPPASTDTSPPPPSATPSTPSTPSNSSAPPPSSTTTSPPPAILTPPPPGTLHSPPPPASLLSSPPPPTSSTNSTTPTPTTPSTTTPSSPGGSSTLYPPPPPVNSSPSPSSDGGGLSTGAAAAVGVVVAAFVLAVVGLFICYTRKKRRPTMEGYQQGYPNGFGMPNSAQFSPPQMSGEAPFLMSSPSRAASANYSGGPPGSRNYNASPYHSGGPNYNSKNYSTGSAGSKMHHSMTDLNIGSSQLCFAYEELFDITGGFSPENILGEGGFGCVYKGKLGDGKEVAVKQLKGGGGQGEREFQAEVEIISRVHHRHLVSLVGFCISEDHRLLVYDFVSNGTLHYHLHGKGRPCMEWSTRVKVAAGSARGLAYLHEDCHPKIIHRDIKSANILIDDHFEAQVADFGLARLTDTNATHVSTRVMGTFGYLAPEYASTGKLTEKSDVFSFGVVLLELITGRKPVDGNRTAGEESLVEWARPLLGQALESEDRDFKELVDPKLGTNYKEVEMFHMIETAAACIRHSASRRPKMSQVVRVLDSLTDEVDISNGVQPGKSQMFNVANTADIRLFQKMAFGSQEFSSDYSHTQSESNRNF